MERASVLYPHALFPALSNNVIGNDIAHDAYDDADARHAPPARRQQWSRRDDLVILQFVRECGTKRWAKIADRLPTRTPKQCRTRWLNFLDPTIDKAPWRADETELIFAAQQHMGNKTDNAIKNHWYSTYRRQRRQAAKQQPLASPMSVSSPGAAFPAAYAPFPRSPDLALLSTGLSLYAPRTRPEPPLLPLFDLHAMTASAPSLQNRQSAWQDLGWTLTDSDASSSDGGSPAPAIYTQQQAAGPAEGASWSVLPPTTTEEKEDEADDASAFRPDARSGCRSRVARLRREEQTTRERSDSADLFLDCVELLSTKKKRAMHTR